MGDPKELKNILYASAEHYYSCGTEENYYNLFSTENSDRHYVLSVCKGNDEKLYYHKQPETLMDIIIDGCVDVYKELLDVPKNIERYSNDFKLKAQGNRREIIIESKYVDIFDYIINKLNKLSNDKYTIKALIAVKSNVHLATGRYYIEDAELVKSPDDDNKYVFEYTLVSEGKEYIKLTEEELIKEMDDYYEKTFDDE